MISNFLDTNLQPLNVPGWIKDCSCFKGKYKRPDGHVCNTASTNNVLFKAEILNKMDDWFDENYGMMSGEDIDFFERIYRLGYKIIWVKNAFVNELVNPNRCNLKYIWNRNFNNGYLRIFNKKKYNRLQIHHYYETFFSLLAFMLLCPLSIICGMTKFADFCGNTAFSAGAFVSLFKSKTLVHYKD